jgi:hypothetical protein
MRRITLAVLFLLTLASCRADTVKIDYGFPQGARFTYRLVARADAAWNIGSPGTGSYEVTFEVTESIRSSDGGEATVAVTMEPVEVEEDNLPSPGADSRSFTLRVGASGEVLDVLEVDGVPARALDADQLVFIGTYRPPLPLEPVSLHDGWEAQQELRARSAFHEIATQGELVGLGTDEDGKIARLLYEGTGPLSWNTDLPQGAAELTGSVRTTSRADFDIDGGFLRGSSSSTSGNFDVRVATESGTLPLTGTLRLVLDLELERI